MSDTPTLSMDETRNAVTSMSGWLKLIGILGIVSGCLTALSIIGLPFAVVLIWAGVLLVQASGASSRLAAEGDPEQIPLLLRKLRTYFVIQGWMIVISLVLMVILVVVGVFVGAPLLEQFQEAFDRV